MICELYLLTTTSTNTTKQTHGYTWAFPSKWITKIQNSDSTVVVLIGSVTASVTILSFVRTLRHQSQDFHGQGPIGIARHAANAATWCVAGKEKQNSLH